MTLPAAAGLGVTLGVATWLAAGWWTALPALATLTLGGVTRRWWLAVIGLAMLAGAARIAVETGRPDPLEGLAGREVLVEARSDGRFLAVTAVDGRPLRARLSPSPAWSLPAGEYHLTGEIRAPRGKTRPGGFDYRAWLAIRGVSWLLRITEVNQARDLAGREVTIDLEAEAPPLDPREALLRAMTLGDRAQLGELREPFARSGTAHLLALSGLHVGFIAGALVLLFSPLGWWRYPAAAAGLWAYVGLVGIAPGVLRAAVMGTVVLLAWWAGRGRLIPWTALGYGAAVTLLVNPRWITDLGWQLSFLAVTGILAVSPWLARLTAPRGSLVTRAGRWVAAGLLTTTAAQGTTLTLVASAFGQIPLFAPLVNAIAVPLAGVVVPVGLVNELGRLWSLPVPGVIRELALLASGSLIAIAEAGARLPVLDWSEVGPPGHLLNGVAWLAIGLAAAGRLRAHRAALVCLAAALASFGASLVLPAPAEVVFLDVGQGDAALVRADGVSVLVDAGGAPGSDYDVGRRTVVPALRALGVAGLDVAVASHADTDHGHGLLAVLRELPVGALVIGPPQDHYLSTELRRVAGERGVKVIEVTAPASLNVGPLHFDVLGPPRIATGNLNHDSVVLRLSAGARPLRRVLFTGDASGAGEARQAPGPAEILKASHHGAADGTSGAYLDRVRPLVAVISAGPHNRFGHPDQGVLDRLAARGITVRRTDLEGTIRVPLR